MKNSRWAQIILLAGLLDISFINTMAAQTGVSLAMVLHDEIYISSDGGGFVPLTADRTAKGYPLWSKDGSKIAFVEKTNRDIALAKVAVIDRNGRLLASFLVHPTSSSEGNAGMTDVEGLEWVTNQNIAVTGSINPSTTEYDVFNSASGRQLTQFFDDGLGASFSPNGQQYAYIGGGPHFTQANEQATDLKIDDSAVFPLDRRQVTFLSPPQWSADSHSLSIIAGDPDGKADYVVMWQANSGVSLISIPIDSDKIPTMYWSGNDLYLSIEAVAPSPPAIWQVFGGRTLVRARTLPETAQAIASAQALSAQMEEVVTAAGGSQADFWCQDCPLAALPRKTLPTD